MISSAHGPGVSNDGYISSPTEQSPPSQIGQSTNGYSGYTNGSYVVGDSPGSPNNNSTIPHKAGAARDADINHFRYDETDGTRGSSGRSCCCLSKVACGIIITVVILLAVGGAIVIGLYLSK